MWFLISRVLEDLKATQFHFLYRVFSIGFLGRLEATKIRNTARHLSHSRGKLRKTWPRLTGSLSFRS